MRGRAILTFVPLVALSTLLAPLAGARVDATEPQTTAHVVDGDEIWYESRSFEGDIIIPNGSSLTIRGATVTMGNGSIRVAEEGRLRVESTQTTSSAIRAREHAGWTAHVVGEVRFVGLPERPVEISGVGGSAHGASAAGGSAIAITGGFAVPAPGRLVADRVEFLDYANGLVIGGEATIANSSFESLRGLALVASNARIEVRDSTFAGPGAAVFLTKGTTEEAEGSRATLHDLRFFGVPTALTARSLHVEAARIRIEASENCVSVSNSVRGWFRDLACIDFSGTAFSALLENGVSPLLFLDGFVARSARGGIGVHSQAGPWLGVRNATIGPLAGQGIVAETAIPALDNVTFRGVQGFNVYLASPRLREVPREAPGIGESGAAGWMLVTDKTVIQVVDADGQVVHGARVEVYFAANDTLALATDTSGQGQTPLMTVERMRIDPEGRAIDAAYRVRAILASGRETVVPYTPKDSTPLVIKITTAEEASTPFATAIATSAALALVAAAWATGRKADERRR